MPLKHRQRTALWSARVGGQARAARLAQGMRVEGLAHLLGCAQDTIHQLEAGIVAPTFALVARVARVLGLDVCELAALVPLHGHVGCHDPAGQGGE